MKLKFNAPVILSFSIIATGVLVLSQFTGGGLIRSFFRVPGSREGFRIFSLNAFRLVTHVIGHKDWLHLLSNFTFILLIGPILEEKYGSAPIFLMMIITALITGILNVIIFPSGLLGASGIVFMFILLISFTNIKEGELPITFVLVVFLFLVKEIWNSIRINDISEFAHIIGGICGGLFGFLFNKDKGDKSDKQVVIL